MYAVIVEDERHSADRLKKLISNLSDEIDILATPDSMKAAKEWFRDNSPPDLVFLDVQLGDGTAFELIDDISLDVPIIFTTAYDEYAMKSFRFNSIDYLLKPIQADKLEQALAKLNSLDRNVGVEDDRRKVSELQRVMTGDFKKRFLVKLGDQFIPINTSEISFFGYQRGATWIVSQDGRKLMIDQSLDQVEGLVSPLDFYRINRQMIVTLQAIKEIHTYFNSRLLIKLVQDWHEDVIVSRDRVAEFKRWMDL